MEKMINKVNNTNKQKNLILKDLEKLNFYDGLNSGRWEQNEYDRLDLMKEWIDIIEYLADEYNIKYNTERLDYNDEYEVDEFYYDLSTDIKIKLKKILNY